MQGPHRDYELEDNPSEDTTTNEEAEEEQDEDEEDDETEFPRSWRNETMREFSVTETDLNLCCFDGGGGSQAHPRNPTKCQWCRGPFCFVCIPFWLPVYVSPAFLNALSWALRTAAAAVASTAICIWTPLPERIAPPNKFSRKSLLCAFFSE